MALLAYPEPGELSNEARHLIDSFSKNAGRPSLYRLLLAWSPPALRAANEVYHQVMEVPGVLSAELKHALHAACSFERGSLYCSAGRTAYLAKEFSFSEDALEKIQAGEPGAHLSEAEFALMSFVRKVAADPASTTREDVEAARVAGWSNAAIVEAVSIAMLTAFANTFSQSMHLADDLGN